MRAHLQQLLKKWRLERLLRRAARRGSPPAAPGVAREPGLAKPPEAPSSGDEPG